MNRSNNILAVVFDWAGTIIDYGSMIPALAFKEILEENKIKVNFDEVRQFMGQSKREHLKSLLNLNSIKEQEVYKDINIINSKHVDMLLKDYEKIVIRIIKERFDFIPGFFEVVSELRKSGIKIGTSTGYTRPIAKVILEQSQKRGFIPDALICASDVSQGRPFPWMCFKNAIELGVYPLNRMVKVGDTVNDILAGNNASMWTVGVTQTGNELGVHLKGLDDLNSEFLKTRLSSIKDKLLSAGANFVIEGVWQLTTVIEQIERMNYNK